MATPDSNFWAKYEPDDEPPAPEASRNGILEGALGLLPAAGGTIGGLAGGAGGTVFGLGVGGVPGAIGGSALGAAGGEALRQHLARALGMNAPESSLEAAGGIAGQAALGGALGGAGAVTGAGLGMAGRGLMRAAPAIGRAVNPTSPAGILAKLALKQVPVVGSAIDALEAGAAFAGRAGAKGAAKSVATKAAAPAAAAIEGESPQGIEAVRRFLRTGAPKNSYSKVEGIFPEPPSKIAGSISPKNVSRGTMANPAPPRAKPLPKQPASEATKGVDTPVSRHEIEYASESGGFQRIEDMTTPHIRNAMNKLHAKIGPNPNKATPVARKQLQALKDEVTFRMKRDGQRTVPGPVGKAQQSAADKFEDEALAKATGKIAGEISPLARQLEQSLAFEKILTQRGFSEAQKRALRRSATEMIQGGTNP